MSKALQVCIIGLGKFGLTLGKELMEAGHEVLGIDANKDHVQHAHGVLTQVYSANATSRETLRQLGIHEMDRVIVSVGGSIENSLLISLYVKEFDKPVIWAKAVNDDHKQLLHLIGVEHVVIPEHYAARFLAKIFD